MKFLVIAGTQFFYLCGAVDLPPVLIPMLSAKKPDVFTPFGHVQLGKRRFKMLFDTADYQSWVVGKDCHRCPSSGIKPFEPPNREVSMYQFRPLPQKLDYGDSTSVTCDWFEHDMSIGALGGQTAICVAKEVVGDILRHYDGSVGFGSPYSHGWQIFQPLLTKLKEKIITFYWDPSKQSTDDILGQIGFGKVKPGFQFTSTKSSNDWRSELLSFSIGSSSLGNGVDAVFDTASGRSEFTSKMLRAIIDAYSATEEPRVNGFVVNCDDISTLPIITISLSEVDLRVKGEYIVQEQNVGDTRFCRINIHLSEKETEILIGVDILRHHHVAFDFSTKKIGFADPSRKKRKDNQTSSGSAPKIVRNE